MGNACSSETVTSPIVFAWAHAGRVCPVLTTGGAVGQTEGPKTPATSLPQENQMEGSATEDLLPGNPQKVMHQAVSPWPRMGSSGSFASEYPLLCVPYLFNYALMVVNPLP